MLKSIWNFSDERRRLVGLLAPIDRNTPVLDVGCGYGRNLDLLRELGFTQLTGVEKNPHLAAEVRSRGYRCLSPEQVDEEEGCYGMLLMSHIIEHFEYPDLKGFIESYLRLLCNGGSLVIVTPLFHNCFYNDFDHVKPYLPIGLNMVFGEEAAQVQFQSAYVLRLDDIDFFRDQLRVQFHPSLYLSGTKGWPIQINRLLKLLFVLSGGYVGRKIGWMGLYRYLGQRRTG